MLVDGGSRRAVPYGADQTIYVVVDKSGRADGEKEVERADLETIVGEFMAGAFADPVRVVAFNTLEHWSQDISADVAEEIQTRCDIEGMPLPEHVRDFFNRHRRTVTLRHR